MDRVVKKYQSKIERMGEMSKFLALIVALLCLSVLIGINVYAKDADPCADDISKFCKDVKLGGGRIANCLKEHKKDLSPACKNKSEEMMSKAKEMHNACANDIDKFCKDVQLGKGSIGKCLSEHETELSPECKEAFGKVKHKRG